MDFDHRNPVEKQFWLSRATLKNRDVLLREVARCDVVAPAATRFEVAGSIVSG
jgi:hypothetical protein